MRRPRSPARPLPRLPRPLLLWLLPWLLVAASPAHAFDVRNIAKSDVDMVAQIHVKEGYSLLRELMLKLYRRNPHELEHGGRERAAQAVEALFYAQHHWAFPELGGRKGADAIYLALDPAYEGDRVFAFVAGLAHMLNAAYGGKTEFFLTDSLDAQKLYNSARNLEKAAWLLATRRRDGGEPWLLSNEAGGEEPNLSFERLFGKLIAQQDMMARIVAQKEDRTINRVLQGVATMVFLPI